MRRIRIWFLKIRDKKRKLRGLEWFYTKEEAVEAMYQPFDDEAYEIEIESKLMHQKDAWELFR